MPTITTSIGTSGGTGTGGTGGTGGGGAGGGTGSGGETGGGTGTTVPACVWNGLAYTTAQHQRITSMVLGWDGGAFQGDFAVYERGGTVHVTLIDSGTTYQVTANSCTGTLDWTPTTPPDPSTLIPSLYAQATRDIPEPTWDIGFNSDVIVKIGLWIAVTNPDPITARAQLPNGEWAQVTATINTIEFDPGNGDHTITCTGPGTHIPDNGDTIDEGPCGYTYRLVTDLGTKTATLTITWQLTSTTSRTTTPTTLDPITTTGTRTFTVQEIQTIGGTPTNEPLPARSTDSPTQHVAADQ